MGIWDHNLKQLVAIDPQAFLDWLLAGAVIVQECPTQLNRDIHMDILYEALYEGQPILVHIEFQRYNEKEMACRLLEYNAYATSKFDRPVLSFVIYLKREGPIVPTPLIQQLVGGVEIWRFHFINVELWEVPTEALRKTANVGIYPLLALTRDGYHPAVVDEALSRIAHAPIGQSVKDSLLSITLTLATLALGELDHQEWLRKRFYMYQDLIRDTEIYQLITQEGVQLGVEQEKVQEIQRFRQNILTAIQAHFPELLSLAQERTAALSDAVSAYELSLCIGQALSLDEARRALELREDA